MKVVIMHDWLTGFRGGERILETLCEMYPDAPIYTLLHKKGSTSPTIESRHIVTSFLNKMPGIHKYYRFYLPLMPLAASLLKIKHEADLVISSSHCVIKGVKKPRGSKHICYLHTPMRYIYDQFDSYFGNTNIFIRTVAFLSRPYLRWWDKKSNKNVDYFLPNSRFVQSRVQKYYEVGSSVVHPYVNLDDFKGIQENLPEKEDFYLMVSAFAPNKSVDLAIKSFNKLGLPLIIIGSGSSENESYLKSLAKSNIKFRGNLSREEVLNHYARAKALIFPGVEDFGITPLESIAAGTPVIAYKKGGILDSMTSKTAHFFTEPTTESLINAVNTLEEKSTKDLWERALLFSKLAFTQTISKEIRTNA